MQSDATIALPILACALAGSSAPIMAKRKPPVFTLESPVMTVDGQPSVPTASRSTMSPRTEPFTIGLIQDHATADTQENLMRAERQVREAAGRGAQIICLKELFHAEYFCKSQQFDRFDLAQDVAGPAVDAMQKVARELEVVVIAPIFERQAPGLYRNSAAYHRRGRVGPRGISQDAHPRRSALQREVLLRAR